jgi:1-acyl-sn-glycerol-3-phosphate acyltransferase
MPFANDLTTVYRILSHAIFLQAMQMLDFIFLKRKLAEDEAIMINNLERAKKTNIPMWLLLFPEGTGKQ